VRAEEDEDEEMDRIDDWDKAAAELAKQGKGKKRARTAVSAAAAGSGGGGGGAASYGPEEFLLLSARNMEKSEGARRAVESEVEALLGEGRRRGAAALAAAAALKAGGGGGGAAAGGGGDGTSGGGGGGGKPKLKWGQKQQVVAAAKHGADAAEKLDGSGGRDDGADFEPYVSSLLLTSAFSFFY